MTGRSNNKYEHFDTCVPQAEPVISGKGMHSQKFLRGTVNKWVRLARSPNESQEMYHERLERDCISMQKYRSHLLVSKGFDTSSARLTAVVSIDKPRIGYSWMPITGGIPLSTSKAYAIWLNSTLGRLVLRVKGGKKLSFPNYNPAAYHDMPYPNLKNVDGLKLLENCFDETYDWEVPQFREGRAPIREQWDDAVAVALDIDRELITECAWLLACDPSVSKEAFAESM